MKLFELTAPRVNANEDEVVVVRIAVAEGDTVRQGQLLFVVETTKAANEVAAPLEGTIAKILVAEGAFVAVGTPLARIATEAALPEPETDIAAPTAVRAPEDGVPPRASAKAARLARENGIDLAALRPAGAMITVQDVETYLAERHPAPPASAAPTPATTGPAFIFGAGGHGVTVADALAGTAYKLAGFLDSKSPVGTRIYRDLAVLALDTGLDDMKARGITTAFIGVGGATSNTVRQRIFEKLQAAGFAMPPAISPRAIVSPAASIGEGSVILPGAVIGPNVVIGRNCIINHNVTVCHDSVIGDHVHLTPGATIAGRCRIGSGATIGMCATVLFSVRVGTGCLVHNSASVIDDLPDGFELNARGQRIPAGRHA